MTSTRAVLAALKKRGTRQQREGLARYGIHVEEAYGVSMKDVQALAKQLGRDHALALELWGTGVYEARLLCAYVDDPAKVTAAQMDRWCRDFDTWATVDTLCFALFDRTKHAWGRVAKWAALTGEFQRRAGFALLAGLAGHDADAPDARFRAALALVERHATDERNFVKKGVSWALRRTGMRNRALHADCLALARELAASDDRTARWIGKDAEKDLTKPATLKRLK
ncbi:MAG: DNA alkylation repair protein [Planctomycetes bacterium]|nr:DNA alkylation repair protein [Planctomycetota bacterium]